MGSETNNKSSKASLASSFAQQLAKCLYDYRLSFCEGNQTRINAATRALVEHIERISTIKNKYQNALIRGMDEAATIIENLDGISEQYNRFCERYNRFANSPDRMSPDAQAYAHQAEIEFSKLLEKAKELSQSDV